MSRVSKIVELGIEDLTARLYDDYRSYSEVAQELNKRNYRVSMTQVRSFIAALDDEEYPLDTDTGGALLAEEEENAAYPPISETVPYPDAPSIFDVVENLDHDHQYLVRLMQSRSNTTIDTSLKILREKREQEKMFVSVADRAKSYREMFAFIQDVVAILDEVDPRVKKLFLERLQRRQALRITAVASRSLPSE